MTWYLDEAKKYDALFENKAKDYQLSLTKPPRSLGDIEQFATRMSAYQQSLSPELSNIDIVIMAADHGVTEENISSFPQSVTAEMIKNFASGGAAIAVLARSLHARLTVFNLGTVSEISETVGVIDVTVGKGTKNFCYHDAMTADQCDQAMLHGKQAADWASFNNCQLFIGGEMGIGNTTSAAAIASRLLDISVEEVAGPGTGLDPQGIQHKINVIKKALALHTTTNPIDVLRKIGGFEIAALAGAYIACAQRGIPVMLDGFISTAAALVAVKINPSITPWLMASHCSQEPGHLHILDALSLEPLVDLKLRLGEGSGAAMVVPLIQLGCKLQSEMASFRDAHVSEKLVSEAV
ncbi:MAG: nicotinate-nucleotide--dimethylbenzimidazole phosphoribosyltransferase [Cellvibrionales bacterium]|nr:nicotinate-nucleotide--dimethylbenzimidazole phosphoribosyltransferase [Cellvibrionales bacterium]